MSLYGAAFQMSYIIAALRNGFHLSNEMTRTQNPDRQLLPAQVCDN